MKTNLRLIITFGLILSAAAICLAQIKTGEYKKVSVSDPQVVAAADFAIEAQSEKAQAGIEILSIETAERQTVAGTNYKLCMQVNIADATTDEPYEQFVVAEVFVDLKNEFSLKNWTATDKCGTGEQERL